jgi:hypothetical protein
MSLKTRVRMIDTAMELVRHKRKMDAEESKLFRAQLEALATPGLTESEFVARASGAYVWDNVDDAAEPLTMFSRSVNRHIRNNAFSAV